MVWEPKKKVLSNSESRLNDTDLSRGGRWWGVWRVLGAGVVRAINTFLTILFIDFHWIQMSKEGWNYSKIWISTKVKFCLLLKGNPCSLDRLRQWFKADMSGRWRDGGESGLARALGRVNTQGVSASGERTTRRSVSHHVRFLARFQGRVK